MGADEVRVGVFDFEVVDRDALGVFLAIGGDERLQFASRSDELVADLKLARRDEVSFIRNPERVFVGRFQTLDGTGLILEFAGDTEINL